MSANKSLENVNVVITGDVLCDTQYLRGYNTFYQGAEGSLSTRLTPGTTANIVAGVCGAVDVVEKVVSVRGLSPRYIPEIGDVVVGRILEVSGKRWRCELGGLHDGSMLLSNVTQPGGLLRRRGRGDELTMRKIFTENDVFVAEVQRISPDGIANLHTRSAEKFGKLQGLGQLVVVRPSLVQRVRRHFHTFEHLCVSLILGVNGYVWVGRATSEQLAAVTDEKAQDEAAEEDDTTTGSSLCTVDPTDEGDVRQAVARVANVIKALSRNQMAIHPKAISTAVEFSVLKQMSAFDILKPENEQQIVVNVSEMRPTPEHSKRMRKF